MKDISFQIPSAASTVKYVANNEIQSLFETLLSGLLFHRPDDPLIFLRNSVDILISERDKAHAAKPGALLPVQPYQWDKLLNVKVPTESAPSSGGFALHIPPYTNERVENSGLDSPNGVKTSSAPTTPSSVIPVVDEPGPDTSQEDLQSPVERGRSRAPVGGNDEASFVPLHRRKSTSSNRHRKLSQVGRPLFLKGEQSDSESEASSNTTPVSNVPESLISALQAVPLFHAAIPRDRHAEFFSKLVRELEIRTVAPHDYIIRKGEMAKAMFFILRGKVEVVGEDGEAVLVELKEGNFFGEIGLLGFAPVRTASVRAAAPPVAQEKEKHLSVGNPDDETSSTHDSSRGCILASLTRKHFNSLIAEFPELSKRINEEAQARLKKDEAKKAARPAKAQTPDDEMKKDTLKAGEFEESANSERIATMPVFQGCPVGFLHKLGESVEPLLLQANTVVFSKGDTDGSKQMYFIVRGNAEVTQGDKVITKLGPNDFFGELSLLFDIPRTFTVKMTTASDVICLKEEQFKKVISEYPEVKDIITKVAEERLKKK